MDKMISDKKRFKSMSQEKDLDCTNATRGVWLVKVPKYVSSRWKNASPLSEAGRLKITKVPGGKPNIKFTLAEDTSSAQTAEEKATIPTEHKFVITNIKQQTLAVFSQSSGENGETGGGGGPSDPGKLVLEGHVYERGECRPPDDQKYMMLKRETILKAREPERKVLQLRKVVQAYKPVNTHKHIIESDHKKKFEGKKARDDKDKVMDILFAAFEKHQYYNIKDLEKITKQPITYLKEILKDICNYNAKNPHKSMWELKPEYRCYKKDEEDAGQQS